MWLLQVFMCCLLYYIQFLVSADEVIISSDATCLEKPHQLHCQLLENVSKQAVNNTIVKIIDKQHILHGVARFVGVQNVTIIGNGVSKTKIFCNVANVTTEAGITFKKFNRHLSERFHYYQLWPEHHK